jgi:hypothetical protein
MANGQYPPGQYPPGQQPPPAQQPVQPQPTYPIPAQQAPAQPHHMQQAPAQPYPMQQAPAQPYHMQQAPAQPGAGAAVALPQYNLPDEAAVLQAYKAHAQEVASWGSGGDRAQFVKWPGPQGQLKWDRSVPAGYEFSWIIYILPPWAPGKNIFRMVRSHFWKSYANPKGRSVGCPGSDSCLICQAREAAMAHPDPQVQDRGKTWGKVRTQWLYNVVLLENINAHFGQDGQFRPIILGAGAKLHKALGDIVNDKKGAINVVDPMRGRPIRIIRRKTGNEDRDIEYNALAQDATPLPSQFYAAIQNLHDLDKQDWQPKYEDMLKAIQEMGLPMPNNLGAPSAPPQQFYQPQPQPPAPSPYPVQAAASPYPAQYPAAQPAQPAPPYYPPEADPYAFPGPGPQPQAPAPVQMAPGWQQPAPSAPPMQSTAQETAYAPQPGQGVPAPPPPGVQPAQAVQAAPQGAIPPAPAVTAPPGVAQPQPAAQPVRQPVQAQPTTRPPCFGGYNPADHTCQGCPEGLRQECVAQAGQPAQPAAQPAQDLNQLQAKLTGGQG